MGAREADLNPEVDPQHVDSAAAQLSKALGAVGLSDMQLKIQQESKRLKEQFERNSKQMPKSDFVSTVPDTKSSQAENVTASPTGQLQSTSSTLR